MNLLKQLSNMQLSKKYNLFIRFLFKIILRIRNYFSSLRNLRFSLPDHLKLLVQMPKPIHRQLFIFSHSHLDTQMSLISIINAKNFAIK